MKDGIIELDSDSGKQLGFTSNRFYGYLWKLDGYIWISAIGSLQEGEGHLSKLFQKIEKMGYGIKVPTPFAKMKAILREKGLHKTKEWTDQGELEVWIKEKGEPCPK